MTFLRKLVFGAQISAVVMLVYVTGLSTPSSPSAQGRGATAVAAAHEAQFVPGEVLIQFKAGAAEVAKQRARARVQAEVQEVVSGTASRGDGKGDLVLARVPAGLPPERTAGLITAFLGR